MARLVGRMVRLDTRCLRFTLFLLIMVPISQECNVPLTSVAFALSVPCVARIGRSRRVGLSRRVGRKISLMILLHLVECTFGSLHKFSLRGPKVFLLALQPLRDILLPKRPFSL
jgi:hypothetical protein